MSLKFASPVQGTVAWKVIGKEERALSARIGLNVPIERTPEPANKEPLASREKNQGQTMPSSRHIRHGDGSSVYRNCDLLKSSGIA